MSSVKTISELMLSFGSMSNKKIQKICYYAYSWYLTLYGEQLAPFQFEAWVHGPVSRELYHYYKSYGWSDIPQYHGLVMVDNEMVAFARKIWTLYGSYSADELEQMSSLLLEPLFPVPKGIRLLGVILSTLNDEAAENDAQLRLSV